MPNTFLWGLGILATRTDIQEKALEAVLLQNKLGDEMNWDKDNYLTAFVKEIGRYFTTFRLAIPRETMNKDLLWKGYFIPVGTTIYTNTHAMNRGIKTAEFILFTVPLLTPGDFCIDEARFVNPERFWPERFMTGVAPEAERAMPHYGFGVGRR